MGTFGNSTNPGGSGFFFDDFGNSQFWDKFGSFPGGVITDLWAYVGGNGGSGSLTIFATASNSIVAQGTVSMGSGSQSINGQGWNHVSGLSQYVAANGDFGIGFWSTRSLVWTTTSSGFAYYKRGLTSGPTGTSAFDGTEGPGSRYVYLQYNPVSSPTISGVSPSVGTTGTSVVITGTQFTYASSVTINGAAASSFTVNSDSQITATVPAGATPGTGTIVVTNPSCSASIAFTVGQIYYGAGASVASIKAVWYGKDMGGGVVTPTKVVGVWVPIGASTKRVW